MKQKGSPERIGEPFEKRMPVTDAPLRDAFSKNTGYYGKQYQNFFSNVAMTASMTAARKPRCSNVRTP